MMDDLAVELTQAGHVISAAGGDKPLTNNIISDKFTSDNANGTADLVIAGPRVPADHPEVTRAKELQVPVYTVADFIYEYAYDKQRLVVTGNHGKTLIASLIIHVLAFHKRKVDFFTATRPHGFASVVKLSDAPLIIIEGQEISTSDIDPTPAFLKYHHHVGIINGIEWQASKQYPTRNDYVQQFARFGSATPKGGILVYFELDPVVAALPEMNKPDVLFVPYKTHPSVVEGGREFLITTDKTRIPLKITGKHNMQNISAAQETLKRIGITNEMFYEAVPVFEAPVVH
jgi:UDP-N-acetylmuramate: L-alanyl-gamma-D-glutamyl-meso-diaminopimelate ligase